MDVADRTEGVVIGMLLGFDDGRPLVVYPSNPKDHALPARSLARLSAQDVGCEVALMFEDGALDRPLIVGRIVDPVREDGETAIIRDGEMQKITAQERIELRVGKSVIIMEKDGHITIRGTHLVSHASGSNHIRGGSVNLN